MVTFAGTVIAGPAILDGIKVPVAAAARELRWFKIEMRAHAESGARLLFYGSWLADLGIRSPGLIGPALGSELQIATELLPIMKAVGSALAGLEGWLALFDLHRSRIALRDAKDTKSRLEDAQQRALKGLDERNKDRAARKMRNAEAQRLRERANQLALAPHTDCTLPNHTVCDLPPSSEPAEIQTRIAELAAQDKPFPAQEDCDAYLAYVDAEAAARKTDGYTSAKLTCARDLGVQSIKAAVDAFGESVLELSKGALESASSVLGIAMGIGHTAQGVFDYRSAERAKNSLGEIADMVESNRSIANTDEKRRKRLSEDAALGVGEICDQGLRAQKEQTANASKWARMRICYGAFSITNGAVAAGVTIALLAGLATGTAPILLAIMTAAATAAGLAWLAFALYRIALRWLPSLKETWERIVIRRELSKVHNASLEDLGNLTLEQLMDLRKAASSPKRNVYLEAAILAKRLQMGAQEGDPNREIRLTVSTLLQVYGMPKTMTSLLKRASFDAAHRAIYRHLRATDVIERHAAGHLNDIGRGYTT